MTGTSSDAEISRNPVYWLGVVIALAHIWINTLGAWPELYTSAFHFGGFALLYALLPSRTGERTPSAVGVAAGVAALACALYLILAEDALYERGVRFNAADWVFSVLAIALAIEFARRATGWIVPLLIILALSYVAWWGRFVGGMLHFPGLSLETVLYRGYFGGDGMFGPIARISSTFVFMFILFGAFLLRSGAGDFVIAAARAMAGRLVGGPGFIAVIGSALTGTVTGSAVANTVSTGSITIPLMRRAGFPARFAAGVEAAASTGGQLMPPVMGAGAFVMASYTQIPYLEIIAVAALPALLYFFSVGCFVRIEAKRQGLGLVAPEDETVAGTMSRRGAVFAIPLIVLVALLAAGFTPTYAAGIAIVAVIAASWIGPEPMGPRAVLDALALGARNMASTAVLLVAIGLVVNVVATAGIGATFSLMINDWAGGSLIFAIVLIALASLVLGMGLPVTAAYIVLATLSAPALYDMIVHHQLVAAMAAGHIPDSVAPMLRLAAPEYAAMLGQPMAGADAEAIVAAMPSGLTAILRDLVLSPAALTAALLSAHMIIFWLSQDSNVTPPVCLGAFAAAAIAETPPMATGLTAWKIAKGLYIIPLLFAFTPLLSADFGAALVVFIFAAPGIYALAGALEGHLEAPLGWIARAILAAAGIALLWPVMIAVKIAALAAFGGVFAASRRQAR